MTKLTKADFLSALGAPPEQVDREIREFADAARLLSSDHPRLIDEHPLQWVGVYQGRVAATGKTLKSLVTQLDRDGVPKERTIIRFIDKEQRTLIL